MREQRLKNRGVDVDGEESRVAVEEGDEKAAGVEDVEGLQQIVRVRLPIVGLGPSDGGGISNLDEGDGVGGPIGDICKLTTFVASGKKTVVAEDAEIVSFSRGGL
jgi:hypothetical protein